MPRALRNRNHNRNEGKRSPLHHRQAGAHPPQTDRLHQSRHTRKQHRHLNKINLVAARQPGDTGDNNRRSHIAGEHRQDMLQPQRHRLRQRRRYIGIRILADSIIHGGTSSD